MLVYLAFLSGIPGKHTICALGTTNRSSVPKGFPAMAWRNQEAFFDNTNWNVELQTLVLQNLWGQSSLSGLALSAKNDRNSLPHTASPYEAPSYHQIPCAPAILCPAANSPLTRWIHTSQVRGTGASNTELRKIHGGPNVPSAWVWLGVLDAMPPGSMSRGGLFLARGSALRVQLRVLPSTAMYVDSLQHLCVPATDACNFGFGSLWGEPKPASPTCPQPIREVPLQTMAAYRAGHFRPTTIELPL